MNCNTTHYRANSSSVPGDPTRYFEAFGRVRKAISVVKKRSGFHEDTIRELTLGPGFGVGRPLDRFRGILTGSPSYDPTTPDGRSEEPHE